MQGTADIRDSEREDAANLTKAETRNEALVVAVAGFKRRTFMAELTQYSGTCADLTSAAELQAARRQRQSPPLGI